MTIKNVKKILYMGCYQNYFSRNAIFLKGLRRNGVEIDEYNVKSHNILTNIKIFIKNFKKLKSQKYDLILFHSDAFIQFILAKILSFIKKKILINDVYISKLQTIYDDRKQYYKKKIPKIFFRIILYILDFIEGNFSDYVILDTFAHFNYFHQKFNVPKKKFRRVFVGAQDDILHPLNNKQAEKDKFIVGFYGTYIPLQGIKYIIEAAKILEKDDQIEFILIGKGQTYAENRKLADELKVSNIKFIDQVKLEELPELISKFDICLGIFGETAKTLQVIPNKIYGGMAMKVSLLSCDSPAIRELFTDNENIILCEPANPKSLVNGILKLKKNEGLRTKIRENAYTLFRISCSIDAIGKSLKTILNNILEKEYC